MISPSSGHYVHPTSQRFAPMSGLEYCWRGIALWPQFRYGDFEVVSRSPKTRAPSHRRGLLDCSRLRRVFRWSTRLFRCQMLLVVIIDVVQIFGRRLPVLFCPVSPL